MWNLIFTNLPLSHTTVELSNDHVTNRKLIVYRFHNTRTRQKERGILCWRLQFWNNLNVQDHWNALELVILIVRIEFSPLETIDFSNGHFYAMETTGKYMNVAS